MELEKTLYRVQERILINPHMSKITHYCSIILIILGLINILLIILLSNREIHSIEYNPNAHDTIYHYQIYNDDHLQLFMKYSNNKELLYLDTELLQTHNFTIINITKQNNDYQFIVSQETLFLRDIAYSGYNIYIINNSTNQTYYWKDKTNHSIWKLILITLGLFVSSAIASLYIKMTIICAPVIIIIMLELSLIFGNRQAFPIFLARAFPWIGLYMNILDRTQRSKKQLILAFALMLLIFYFVYLSSVIICNYIIFKQNIPYGLEDNFFGLVAMNEFASLLFLRTRSSIYFVPKFIILYYYIFLLYIHSTNYGFYSLAILALTYISLGTFFSFLNIFEIPSLSWNTQSRYTPSIDRPRCYYLPVFSMNWVNDLPQPWTMFYPQCGIRYFQVQNMALIDRNFPLLNHVIEMQEV